MKSFAALLLLALVGEARPSGAQDIDKVLERADKLLEEAKTSYEEARAKSLTSAFIDAGFKLEEARIKYLVLQEIGSPDRQKIATDRLRAVNQLSKLIHDGKVAVSGTPADSPPEKPAPAAPGKPVEAPAAEPSVKPAKLPSDVTARAPVPEAAKQREAEKLIRDLFKEQYSKKAAVDRQALAKTLLAQAAQTADDPVAMWVLYREAQDVAVQLCDVRMALSVIDATARVFDVDAMSMKNAALTAAGKAAKTPGEFAALAESLLKLIDDFIAADQYDSADKAAAAAIQHARRANNPVLVSRGTIRAKEAADAKSRFQALKGVLETLAKTPDDPGANNEMGQFLCFVKGNWDLGVRFLAKGSDAALKALAQKEIALPIEVAEIIGLADGWWDQAEKEKSPRKERLKERARTWYEAALPQSTGLARIKLEKRLESLPAPGGAAAAGPGGAIDLLRMIDPDKDAIRGVWKMATDGLTSPAVPHAHLQIPYAPPPEYDLKIQLTLKEGAALDMGIVGGSKWFTVIVNGWGGTMSGIWGVNGKNADMNETTSRGQLFERNKASTIVFLVRKDGVTLTSDGKTVFKWKGDYSSIVPQSNYVPRDPTALFLAAYDSSFQFSAISLTPVSGQGKKLR